MLQPPTLHRSLSRSFILTSVMPLLLLSFVILYHLVITYTKEIKTSNQLLARAISGQVEAELHAPLAILNNLRYQLENHSIAPTDSALQQLLNSHVAEEAYFDSIYLLSSAGTIQVVGLPSDREHLRSDFTNLSLAHLNFYRSALQSGEPVWSDTFQSLVSSDMALAVCIPLRDQRALIGNISIKFLRSLLLRISRGEHVETSIIDRRGEVIAFSDPHRSSISFNLLQLQLVQKGLAGQEGSGLFSDGGVSHLGSVARIDGPGWLTLISQPTTDAYAPVSNAGLLFGAGTIIAVALAMLLALRKARLITRPFVELSQQVEEIADGSYDLPPVTPFCREVAVLDKNIHKMATAIREREMALLQRERDYRTLAENLPAIVYRVCIQENNRIMLMNNFQQQMTGLTSAELIDGGTALYASKIHPDELAGWRRQIARAIANHEGYSCEYRFQHKDGHFRFFAEWGTPVYDAQGQLLFLDGVVFDNSEQQHARELLLQTEKMMSVGGLAAGMAHEINNPLAGILINLKLIQQRLDPTRPANQQRAKEKGVALAQVLAYLQHSRVDQMLSTIDDAARRTTRIVENVLSFSRKATGDFMPTPVPELLLPPLRLAEHNFDLRERYDFKKIKVNLDIADNLPKITCQPSQIQQVILNILENGAQAMFESTAELRQPVLTLSAQQSEDSLVIKISDNGPGMEESVRRRIFEPFFTTKEPGKGTGLGLSVSYFIVNKNHQGTMVVDSIPGVGSTFTIKLPYVKADPA